MVHLASLSCLSLAIGALALPFNQATEVILPLTKVKVFQGNGVFNPQILKAHVASLHIKYRQGQANYLANTGRPLPGARNETQDRSEDLALLNSFSKVPPRPAAVNNTLEPRQYLGITSQKGLMWTGKLGIGTPSDQEFVIDFDTGSADLWVPSVACTAACGTHKKFDAAASSTAQETNQPFVISYADGSTSSGSAVFDTVELADLYADQQSFAAITDASESFAADPQDGIMGLSFQTISQLNQPPVFQTLVSQKRVASPTFAFRLSEENGELCIGGVNRNRYSGSFDWTDIDSDAYWSIPGTVSSSGEPVLSNSFILDTGSTLVVAPTDQAAQLWSTVPGAVQSPDYAGYWTYPCDAPPSFSFSFGQGGESWSISSSNINLGHLSHDMCVGAVIGSDLGITSWILGDAFLLGVYAAFDAGSTRVGLATPR